MSLALALTAPALRAPIDATTTSGAASRFAGTRMRCLCCGRSLTVEEADEITRLCRQAGKGRLLPLYWRHLLAVVSGRRFCVTQRDSAVAQAAVSMNELCDWNGVAFRHRLGYPAVAAAARRAQNAVGMKAGAVCRRPWFDELDPCIVNRHLRCRYLASLHRRSARGHPVRRMGAQRTKRREGWW